MYGKHTTRFLGAIVFVIAITVQQFAQSSPGAEPPVDSALEDKADSLITLESLARAEQRVEALRTRLMEIQMNELEVQGRIEQLDYQLRPDQIQRALAFVGSARPMDELRGELQKKLEYEKARQTRQLDLLATNRQRLESAISVAEKELQRIRQQLNSKL
jgi:predicted  nucleic acid-binding Zn-ribbon protein